MERGKRLWLLRFLFDKRKTFLLGDLTMDLPHVVFGWDGEVSCFHNSPVDVLSPILSHLFFVYDAQELSHELRIDCQQFYDSIPNAEDLVWDAFDIPSDKCCDFFWLTVARIKSTLQGDNSDTICSLLLFLSVWLELWNRWYPFQFLDWLIKLHVFTQTIVWAFFVFVFTGTTLLASLLSYAIAIVIGYLSCLVV